MEVLGLWNGLGQFGQQVVKCLGVVLAGNGWLAICFQKAKQVGDKVLWVVSVKLGFLEIKDKLDPSGYGKFNMGKLALGGLGVATMALPLLMGGGDDEDDGPVDQMDVAGTTNRARNYYSGLGGGGGGLDFMPKKKYVDQNFYAQQSAADGGRIGYAGGMLVR